MADTYIDIEIFAIVDADGEYTIGKDAGEAAEAYTENISEDMANPRRCIVVKLRVPTPTNIEVSATVPAEAAAVENLAVK